MTSPSDYLDAYCNANVYIFGIQIFGESATTGSFYQGTSDTVSKTIDTSMVVTAYGLWNIAAVTYGGVNQASVRESSSPPGGTVPEPSTLLITVLGVTLSVIYSTCRRLFIRTSDRISR